MVFRNFYSAKWTRDFGSREEILVYAVKTTRNYFPTFWPEPA